MSLVQSVFGDGLKPRLDEVLNALWVNDRPRVREESPLHVHGAAVDGENLSSNVCGGVAEEKDSCVRDVPYNTHAASRVPVFLTNITFRRKTVHAFSSVNWSGSDYV